MSRDHRGATDSEAFEAYVEHSLKPSLCEGQVVVLDGLGAHRTEQVKQLAGAEPHRGGFQQDKAPRA